MLERLDNNMFSKLKQLQLYLLMSKQQNED